MLRIVGAGLTALFVTASPLAYAQTAASAATPSAADWNTLTDMRIDVVKAALKLTPDQAPLDLKTAHRRDWAERARSCRSRC